MKCACASWWKDFDQFWIEDGLVPVDPWLCVCCFQLHGFIAPLIFMARLLGNDLPACPSAWAA
jgi:hypothetical protein